MGRLPGAAAMGGGGRVAEPPSRPTRSREVATVHGRVIGGLKGRVLSIPGRILRVSGSYQSASHAVARDAR